MKTHRRTKTQTYQKLLSNKQQPNFTSKKKQRPIYHSRRYKSELNEHDQTPIYKLSHEGQKKCKTRIPSNPRIQYNKWYIRPEIRMKKPIRKSTSQQNQNIEFAYNRLYEENSVKQGSPFEFQRNDKLLLLQKIPLNNIRLLENFKRSQQSCRKRVPKIVQLFLNKKSTNQYRSSM